MFGKKPEGVEKKKQRKGFSALIWMFMGSLLTLMIGVFLYLWQPFKAPGENTEPRDGQQISQDDSHTTDNKTLSAQTQTKQTGNQQNSDDDYQFYDLLPEQDVTPIPDKSIPTQNKSTDQRADVTLKLPSEDFDNDKTYTSNDTYEGSSTNNSQATTNNSSDARMTGQTQSNPSTTRSATKDNNSDIKNSQKAKISKPETNTVIDPIENIIANTTDTIKDNVSDSIKQAKKNNYILQINSYDSAEDADKRRAEVLLAGIDANVVKKTNNGETMYQVISESYDSKTAVFMAQQRLQSSGIDAFVVERKK